MPAQPTPFQIPSTLRQLALLVPLFFVLTASKSPDSLTNAQFWAEDGVIFFQQQLASSFPQLGKAYAGYLHVIPRLTAWLATLFNASKAPFIYNLLACIIASVSVSYTALRLKRFLPLVLSVAIFALVPINGEIFGTITNIQWFTQFALLALCLPMRDQEIGRRGELCAVLCVLVAGLTGPAAIFVTTINVAILALSHLLIRVRPSWDVASKLRVYAASLPRLRVAAAALCALIQVVCVLLNTSSAAHDVNGVVQYGLLKLPAVMFGQIIPTHVFGFYFLTPTLWILLEICCVVAVLRNSRMTFEAKAISVQLLLFSLLLLFSAAALKDTRTMAQFGSADRYFYTIKFVVWWFLYLAMTGYRGFRRSEVLAFVICAIAYFGLINHGALQRPLLLDMQWRKHAAELDVPGPHDIPINPQLWHIQTTTPANGPAKPGHP